MLASAPSLISGLVAVAAAVGDAGVPFIEAQREAADRECLRDRDPHLRLTAQSFGLARGRTHCEAAQRHHHHFWTCGAVLEVFGLARTRLEAPPLVLPSRDLDSVAARGRYGRRRPHLLRRYGHRSWRGDRGLLLLQLLQPRLHAPSHWCPLVGVE